VRRNAAMSLQDYGPDAMDAAPALIEAMKDSDRFVSSFSQFALRHIIQNPGANSTSLVAPLVVLLASSDAEVRKRAAAVLSHLGRSAKKAVPALLESLKSKDQSFRWQAAAALAAIGDDSEAVVSALVEMVKGGQGLERLRGIIALGKMGPKARPAIP